MENLITQAELKERQEQVDYAAKGIVKLIERLPTNVFQAQVLFNHAIRNIKSKEIQKIFIE